MAKDIRDSVCSGLVGSMNEAKELGNKKSYDRDKKFLEDILEIDCIKNARPWLYSKYREKLRIMTFE